jgi:Flp pilus assembly protein TadG
MKIRKLFLKDKDGQTIIEFALLLPILLMVLFGVTEFGRAIMVKNVLHTAAREGARLAAVSAVGDSLVVQARVVTVLEAASIDDYQIFITTDVVAKTVEVEVTTDFEVLSGGVLDPFMGTLQLKGSTVMRLEG